jgi:phosphate transport system substrate-binding protein
VEDVAGRLSSLRQRGLGFAGALAGHVRLIQTGELRMSVRDLKQALVASLVLTLAGCSASQSNQSAVQAPVGGILLKGAGATFPAPLYKRWFQTYQQAHPQVAVAYDAVGSGEGIRRFLGNKLEAGEAVDFGASDAAMQDEDIAKASRGVVLLPATAGGVVLAYNLPDVPVLKLTRAAYSGIFLGEITSWDDRRITASNPGVKLPRLTITTAVRQDGSGTTFAFTRHLDAISPAWHDRFGAAKLINFPGLAMRGVGNERVAALIQSSVGSIGYVGYEFARRLGLKTASLENREGQFVAATQESCTSALASVEMPENLRAFIPDPPGTGSYPIVTLSWILLYRHYDDPARARSLRDLLVWSLKDGQDLARESGYVALPNSVREKALAALKTIVPES